MLSRLCFAINLQLLLSMLFLFIYQLFYCTELKLYKISALMFCLVDSINGPTTVEKVYAYLCAGYACYK